MMFINIMQIQKFTTQGVFVYEKDNEGNYVLNQANKLDIPTDGLGISNYRIIYENYNDITNAKYGYIIISNGKKVSRVEITINDVYKYNANLEIGKESMVLIKENLTEDESAGIRLEVKYFDENNNELLQQKQGIGYLQLGYIMKKLLIGVI